jgi:SAM-dependent methyltransferase
VAAQPQIYTKLAPWFHLLTAPDAYAEEAATYRRAIIAASTRRPHTVLELGSGGGNNASHLKRHFRMTLTDLSPQMLRLSRKINPECEHIQGDMRALRLGRQFDAVFVHDAVMYMTNERDLRAAIETAYVHCAPGGVALFAPDCTKETYRPATRSGGHDDPDGRRALRYLEWDWDPVQEDTTYHVSMVLVLRDGNRVRVVDDRHTFGVFSRRDWLRLLREAGFRASRTTYVHSESGTLELFLGLKPEDRPAPRWRRGH